MASFGINVHRIEKPREAAKQFLDKHLPNGRVLWDTQGNGIRLCAGKDWEIEALRFPGRYVAITNDADLDDMFRNYEDGE